MCFTYSDLREEVSVEVDSFLRWQVSVDVLLEVLIGDLVAILEFTIVITLFLHGVIGQMNKPVAQILQVKFHTGGADVAILVEVALVRPKGRGQHAVHTDVKFTIVHEQGLFYVFLNDMRMVRFVRGVHFLHDLTHGRANKDSVATIRILTWLHYPDVLGDTDAEMLLHILYVSKVVLFVFLADRTSIILAAVALEPTLLFDMLFLLGIKDLLFKLFLFFE